MASLKVHTTLVVASTPVEPLVGVSVVTRGRVVSAVAEALVEKLLVNGTTALPTRSVTPATSTW